MEGKNQYDELILKLLSNQLNEDEKASVLRWINEDPTNRKYFEEFERLWQLTTIKDAFNKINIDEEWDHLKQAIDSSQNSDPQLTPGVEKKQDLNQKGRIYKFIIGASIAASVLVIVGLGWKLWNNAKSNETNAPLVKEGSNKPKDSLIAFVRHEVNSSGQTKTLLLSDGSVIILSDRSEVSFQEPFTGNQRNIFLVGKAYFKVAKDKTKPFAVVSGDISTTALGTEFTVTAFENANSITVRLYEGKVVIKPVGNHNLTLKKDVYLLPGQEFVYESKTTRPKVKTFKLNGGVAPEEVISEELARDLPSLPQNRKGSWYMFNNQSLAEVLGILEQMYNVKIDYNIDDIRQIYFTGQFDREESVEIILKQISILNNLSVTRKDNLYTISK